MEIDWKSKSKLLFGICCVYFCLIHSSQAHHSFSHFDRNVQRIIVGEVTEWVFDNPHVWLHIREEGSNEISRYEGAGIILLSSKGFNQETFEKGDEVTVMYCPLRDGTPGGALGWVIRNKQPMIDLNNGGCWVTEEMETQWLDWLEKGYTSNLEAEAAQK